MVSSSRCWEVAVATADDTSEGLTNFLWELGALGVIEEAEAGTESVLRAFFPETTEPGSLDVRLRTYLQSLREIGFSIPGDPRISPLSDPGWAEAWRAHFRPVAAGRNLLVVPPWIEDRESGRVVITIEPARAFGTGHHGTTLGCLETLETILEGRPSDRAIDVGTGSGILAIAAARLGVAAVLAVDSDPDAVAAARTNAALNGVGAKIEVRLADVETLETAGAPLVIANLLSAAHRKLGPRYAALVVPGGRLVLGGILDDEARDVAATVEGHGFAARGSTSRDGWTTLELERAPLRRHA